MKQSETHLDSKEKLLDLELVTAIKSGDMQYRLHKYYQQLLNQEVKEAQDKNDFSAMMVASWKYSKMGLPWFQLALMQGHSEAQCDYAGQLKSEVKLEGAFAIYVSLAEKQYSRAQFELADFYYQGIWVEKDIKEAFRLYKLAAKQGYEPARTFLAASVPLHIPLSFWAEQKPIEPSTSASVSEQSAKLSG